ncbi:MAG: protein-glutamate O-methyltransferase CheR [Bacteroidetes bacterium]|nr:protein-glutamate O-methyltransferase CheR [Bacteroidota bacterium]
MIQISETDFNKITAEIYRLHSYDFRSYSKSSLSRRLQRFMSLHAILSIDEFIAYLNNGNDINSFVTEITVNTTEMFRDPSFWQTMRQEIIPSIRFSQNIRIWHAGCSSGEEVLSMCILLEELNLNSRAVIYATDIDSNILKKAAKALYPARNYDENEKNYQAAGGKHSLKKYIKFHDRFSYQFHDELYKNVIYKKLDLVHEILPFKFDLILCRNVLIYFNFDLQEKVISNFADSLYQKGILAIGQNETILGNNLNRLSLHNEREKIYQLK